MAVDVAIDAPALPDGIVAVVKRDCPTCVLVSPVLGDLEQRLADRDERLTVFTQDDPTFPEAVAAPVDDTDLDVSHAVVRYLELVKVAALIERPADQSVEEAMPAINERLLQAVTAEQREIFLTSALDEYLLDAERDERRRAQAVAAREEPSLEAFLPRRGDGLVLSASDVETYRTCPLRYKFARIFRIPQEPTIHQRFGILVHQVLERYHQAGTDATQADILGLLEASWRRSGFGDSEEERQLHGKATASLVRYHERFRTDPAEPLWFERSFSFHLGPHTLRGRVDRIDRLPDGGYVIAPPSTLRLDGTSLSSRVEQVATGAVAPPTTRGWGIVVGGAPGATPRGATTGAPGPDGGRGGNNPGGGAKAAGPRAIATASPGAVGGGGHRGVAGTARVCASR